MIYGVGIDITDIARIKAAQRRNSRFKRRILTQAELAVYETLTAKRQAEYLAGRFSVKESFSKALGTGFRNLSFLEIEVLDNANGQPLATKSPFSGRVLISISHTKTLVMTEVILERRMNE
uniref:Holo-[acyl-carrier-protein] synthase n=1 Tax=Loigolactobacillus rennini TaxID=238013 RepID=A0A1K2I4X5_9LACO|nr:Holo-[acyl-carrier protein] synthase [Loigolactobacillus rennini]